MRKITQQAAQAFKNANKFKKDNTEVEILPNVTILKLYGYYIAYLYNDPERTLSITNAGYFTNTTKERLNGIEGVRINQKAGVWYLNGNEWGGIILVIHLTTKAFKNYSDGN
jgi:hypothetical protein